MRPGESRKPQAVYQAMPNLLVELAHGHLHREMSRPKDVDRVDLIGMNQSHRPPQPGVSGEKLKKTITLRSRQLLRIIEPFAGKALRQDHRRRGHRTGQRAATRLIHTHDGLDAAGVKGIFKCQIRHS